MILDLDGVVTDTAALHERAWKDTFDTYLARREERGDAGQPRFSSEEYRRHVDGKPRLDGVRSFLASRGIAVDEGQPDDSADADTVHGLGKRKNEQFHRLLDSEGVRVFDDAVAQLRAWRHGGVPTAIVSSSRNCRAVLRAAGIEDLFDARVDGEVLAERGLAGKPAPDMFVEAARELSVEAARSAVFEDAEAGVRAGRAGGFGAVVGVARGRDPGELSRAGADLVTSDLREAQAPPAFAHLDDIRGLVRGRRLAVFLDYDGTLTPIVDDPDAARLSADMRQEVVRLARACPVAVVSGRDLRDVKARVGLDLLYYAGSHGFEIAGPDRADEHRAGVAALPALDRAEAALRRQLAPIAGALVERKRFSLAIHYRQVAEDGDVSRIAEAARREAGRHQELRQAFGKKVIELRPDVDWDKGRALQWILGELDLDEADVLPIYIGDDQTDEDAFRAVRERGLGVVVAERPAATVACCRLADPPAVKRFLAFLADTAAQASG